jgi:hypothetical protein
MWMFISGASAGIVMGFILCGLMSAAKREDECRQCPAINVRDMDIRAVERSRDLFRERCDQQEVLIHSLRTKLGIKNHKEGKDYYRRLGVV